MDLIYTDNQRKDIGVMKDYTFDLAFGIDENNFELTLDQNNACCEPNSLVYIENTEYGGIVDSLGVITKDGQIIYGGRTWHGIVASKVIEPVTVSGEANQVIDNLLKKLGLTNLFVVTQEDSGLVIENYSFTKHVDAYTGITRMLESVSGKLKFMFSNGVVTVSALPSVDYSKDEQFDNDQVEMNVNKVFNSVNHLVCIPKEKEETGEQKSQLPVVHLYRDGKGTYSQTQTFYGLDEIVSIYEYSSQEDMDELLADLRMGNIEKIKNHVSNDKAQMDFASEESTYDVGDTIGAFEITTGIFVADKITKKIVTIRQSEVNIEYKVGE